MKDIYCYIVAPPGIVTGGPEYCNQICHQLNQHEGVHAKLLYYSDKFQDVHPLVYEARYRNPFGVNLLPRPDSFVFFPETWYSFSQRNIFSNVKYKFIVWMSVNLYFASIKPHQLNFFSSKYYHLCPSDYSRDYLTSFAKVPEDKIFHIGDPPSDVFFQAVESSYEKENRIALQLGKNFLTNDIIEELAKRGRDDIKVDVINNFTTEQVIDCLKKSKVFVHLSYNPGLERMQQEAILLDNCVIQSKLGCGKYYNDVPIPEEYKFDITQGVKVVKGIVDKIEECVDEYEEKIGDFKEFKGVVYKRREELSRDIEKIVEFMREKVNESEKSQSSEETTTVS